MSTATDRIAVVTGAGRGIGAAVARRLHSDGLSIAVVDRDLDAATAMAKELAAAGGGRAQGFHADVSDEQSVEAAIEAIAAELGAPTVLVNNAGVTRDNLVFRMSVDDWDTVMSVHLRGTFLMSRAVQRFMLEKKFGRIVNISSTAALGNRGQANYSAAKAGIEGLTRTLSIELGPFGVTVNAVAPGFIVTDMTAQTSQRLGISFEEYQQLAIERIAVRRVGVPEDVAAAIAFLVRDDASYVSGQVIQVAGGPRRT